MKLLAVNTVYGACDLCIRTPEALFVQTHEMAKGQDAALPGLVAAMCEEAALTLDALDRVAVVTGPGSFTGLRIGLAFARGLGVALKVPVIGVSALEAAAPHAQAGIVALVAKRRPPDLSWWTAHIKPGTPERPALAERDLQALSTLAAKQDAPLFSDDPAKLKALGLDPNPEPIRPTATRLAEIAEQAAPDLYPPHAAYVRAPDAALPKR